MVRRTVHVRDRRAPREVVGEMAAGDLVRRPPEQLVGDRGAVRGVVPQVADVVAADEHPAQHGPERLRYDVGARGRGDHPGRDVGLLGRQAALLDPVRGDVADRVHAVGVQRTREVVDRHEAERVGGDAAHVRSHEPGERDDPVDLGRAARRRATAAAPACSCTVVSVRTSTPWTASSRPTSAATSGPNAASGAGSGVMTRTSAPGHRVRGLQRELVERQRPRRPARHHERDAADASLRAARGRPRARGGRPASRGT